MKTNSNTMLAPDCSSPVVNVENLICNLNEEIVIPVDPLLLKSDSCLMSEATSKDVSHSSGSGVPQTDAASRSLQKSSSADGPVNRNRDYSELPASTSSSSSGQKAAASAKPFTCNICDKSFGKMHYCHKHMRNVHGLSAKGEKLTPAKLGCGVCDLTFTNRFSLQRHTKLVHPDSGEERFQCGHCGYETTVMYYLKRHIRKHEEVEEENDGDASRETTKRQQTHNHVGDDEDIFEVNQEIRKHGKVAKTDKVKKCDADGTEESKLFKCAHCGKGLADAIKKKRHERICTKNFNKKPKRVYRRKCPKCTFVSGELKPDEIHEHFKNVHNVPICWETYTFNDLEAFYEWKDSLEKSNVVQYATRQNLALYSCHRSGNYRPKSKDIRRRPLRGTCKIDGFCPSAIHLKKGDNGQVFVQYMPCHVGHKNEMKYIRLTREEREKIGHQLLNNTPEDAILADARQSLTNVNNLQRLQLLTKKDIVNIKKTFNISNETTKLDVCDNTTWVEDKTDKITTNDESKWMENLKSDKNTCVFHYKPQGTIGFGLMVDDYLLIYMSNAQKTMIESHGGNIISVDSAHKLNTVCSLKMYSLLVVDDNREGYPAAFMLTNRCDEYVVGVFFQKIKEKCCELAPNVFMSDVEDTVYSMWCSIMGPARLHIVATSGVLKAWQGSLNKIKAKDKREHVYNILKRLLYEVDKGKFHELLDTVLKKNWYETETVDYFKQFYEKFVENMRYKVWAHCYLIERGINPDVSMEIFDKFLKQCRISVKRIERLDEMLAAILKFLDKKIFEWYSGLERNSYIRGQLDKLGLRHRKSLTMSDVSLVRSADDTWQVLSISGGEELYEVKKVKDNCVGCQLLCRDCAACWHRYVCTCRDSTVKNNMCVHIHFVARRVRDELSADEQLIDEEIVAHVEEHENSEQLIDEEIVACVDDHDNGDQLIDKEIVACDDERLHECEFREKFEKFVNFCNGSVKSRRQMAYVAEMMEQIRSKVVAMSSTFH